LRSPEGCGLPVTRLVPVKPTSNPPIMSRSDSGSDVSSSSSEGSDNERSTNSDLVIPSPVELSDSEEDGVSSSQHKLAMKKQWSPKVRDARRKFASLHRTMEAHD
jgi:hypothetical protein